MSIEEIKNELLELGFNVNSRGIIFWVDALMYVKNNPLWWDTLDIYEYIAEKYKISIYQAERNLRTAISPAKRNIQEKYNYYRPIKNQTFLNLFKLKLMSEE